MTSVQISEWEAYDKLDPIGEFRGDLRNASLMALLSNIVSVLYHEEGKEPVIRQPQFFMPIWRKEDMPKEVVVKQSVDDMKAILMAFAKSHNKKVQQTNDRSTRKPFKKSNR